MTVQTTAQHTASQHVVPEPSAEPVIIPRYDLKHAVSEGRLLGLWRLLHGFRLVYLIASAALGVAALSKTASFFVLQYFADDVLGKPDVLATTLPLIVLGFAGLAFAEGLFTFLSGRLAARAAEGATLRLRNYLFDHVQRLPFSYFDKTQTGDLIQRSTSDVDAVRRFFADQAIGLGRIMLLFMLNLVAMLAIHVELALVSSIAVPLIIVLSLFFFGRVQRIYNKFQEQDAVLSTILQENLTGVRVVKAFARQEYEQDKYETANLERFRRGRRLLMMYSYYWPLTDIICGAQFILGILLASTMVISGTLTLGSYLAYIGIVWLVLNPLRNLGRIIVQMSEASVSFKRILDILRVAREALDSGTVTPDGAVRGEIIFEAVSFAYEPGKPVLRDISFRAEPGQMIALLGSTGSGKTSLVNLLPRFYDYTSGKIMLDGRELADYSRSYLRDQIGIVEQEPFLFSRSIRENITYGVKREVTDEEVFVAARAAAIHDVIMTFPDGYRTIVGEKGVTLSGGQKQRTVIARTLLKDPRILILDDATSSVDTETEVAISAALDTLMKGRTSFVIAHRIQTVMKADLILVFDKGRIVQRGTHTELLAQPGIYRQIHEAQTRIEAELEAEIARA